MLKKILYPIVYVILFSFALHATFIVITNMTLIEFITYMKIDEWEEEKIPVIMWQVEK